MGTKASRRSRSSGRPFSFLATLGGPRFFLVYLSIAPLAAALWLFRGYGSGLLVATVANLALLCLYVVVIEVVSRDAVTRPHPIRWPAAETAALVTYTLFLFVRSTAQAAGTAGVLPIYGQVDGLVVGLAVDALRVLWIGGTVPVAAGTAVSNLFWLVAVPFAFCAIVGYRPGSLGIGLVRWWVVIPCILVAGALRYLSGDTLTPGGIGGLLSQFVWAILVTAVAEEFFFRGLLQTRLEASTGRTLDSLALAAFAWVLLRLPMLVALDGHDITLVGAKALAVGLPSGLAWGYVYLRTRSLAPGILWRAWPWPAFPF